MFNRTLTTILGIICFLSFSLSDDKYSSYRELKKISNGMSIIHTSNSMVGIIAFMDFILHIGLVFIMNGFNHLII